MPGSEVRNVAPREQIRANGTSEEAVALEGLRLLVRSILLQMPDLSVGTEGLRAGKGAHSPPAPRRHALWLTSACGVWMVPIGSHTPAARSEYETHCLRSANIALDYSSCFRSTRRGHFSCRSPRLRCVPRCGKSGGSQRISPVHTTKLLLYYCSTLLNSTFRGCGRGFRSSTRGGPGPGGDGLTWLV